MGARTRTRRVTELVDGNKAVHMMIPKVDFRVIQKLTEPRAKIPRRTFQ
jgi:hypothetical protein